MSAGIGRTASAEVGQPAGPTRGSPQRRIALVLFAATAIVYALTAPGHLGTTDMRVEFAVAQSIVDQGDFTVAHSLPYEPVPYLVGPDGRHYTDHGLGQSILLIPAALVGRLGGCTDPAACPANAQHAAEFAASFLDGLAAALAVTLMFLLALDLGAAMRPALALALLFGFTTIVWAYAHDAFDVGPTGAVLVLALYALVHGTRRKSLFWLAIAGAAAGFAVLIRVPDVLFLPILGAYLVTVSWRLGWTTMLTRLLAFGLPVAAMLAIFGWYNWVRFGSAMQTGYTLPSDYFTGARAYGFVGWGAYPGSLTAMLFSPGRSIFIYSPILIAAAAGLPLLWRHNRALAATVIGVAGVNLLFYAAFGPVPGWAWGPRYFVPVMPFLILPLLPVLQRWQALPPRVRYGIYALAAAGIVIQLLDVGIEFGHQIQLQLDAGIEPDGQWWNPQSSAIWRHAAAMIGLLHGSAAYPVSYQPTDLSTATPLTTTLDVWWTYAWINGVNPLVLVTVLGGAVAALTRLVVRVRRALRLADGPAAA
ncbi:MAG: hypothetical protein ABI352_04940 [Candidatus Dormibacter sp.]